ncbi:MAG: helix-turn-helix domain-containing protein [Acidovorax sp.]|nr:helix-turn-helix domain-containing protein [Acidovorax sp.]
MSTIIMSNCWPLQGMTPAQKAVLISLADQANDDGYCWPSIKTISVRTCLSERAVQGAIRWLSEAGILRASERRGTSTVYQLTPAAYAPLQEMRPAASAPPPPQEMHPAPAASAPPPPQEVHPTPADAAPKPSMNHQLNHQGSKTPRQRAEPFARPDDVTVQTWADWLELRKAKRAPVTETVVEGARAEAQKAGMTLEAFLQVWCTRGSQGLQASWLKPGAMPGVAAGDSNKHAAAAAAIFDGVWNA